MLSEYSSKGQGGHGKKKKAVPVLSEKLTGPENVRTNTVSFITLPRSKKEDLESCKPEYPGYKDMCTEDIKIQYIEAQCSGSRRQQSKRCLLFAVCCKSYERCTRVTRHVMMKLMISRKREWGAWA